MNQDPLEKLLARAKIGIMEKPDTVFFSTLCSSLETRFTGDVNTAATDGIHLLINPDFFTGLDLEERIFLLAHETLHVAYLHTLRCEHRDHEIFNIAADYVINLELAERGFKIIKGALLDNKYQGMSTEEVYEKLIDGAEPLPKLPMQDILPSAGESSDPLSNPNLSTVQNTRPSVSDQVQSKISKAIMLAEMTQQSQSIPPSIKRYFDELKKPVVNWKAVLQRFMSQLCSDNYSWSRPNKRLLPNYLPKLRSQQIGRIDFAIDTSGSISPAQFTQFISELHSVLRMLKPKQIGVYQFDHALQGSNIVKSMADILTLDFLGGGGTQPQCALDEFEKNQALALIILTDGRFNQALLRAPKRPVIWVVYNNVNFKAPFGNAVHFELFN